MPAIVAFIAHALGVAAGYITWRVLAALGIGFVTYAGVGTLITGAEAKVFELIGELGTSAQSLFGVLRIGTCLKIWFAALTMRATLWGMAESGNVRKMTQS